MSPRPKKTPAAAAPKGRPIRRSQPRAVAAPRDASAPDYSRTPLDAIPLAGRLMAIADVYDALISRRVYKEAMPHEQAVQIIAEGRGTHFDPDMVDAFLQIHPIFRAIAERYADGEIS